MAGLYLIGFAAPAFEAAACYVGETADPVRNVPRAMRVSALMALVYFVLLPVVWLGVAGAERADQRPDAVPGADVCAPAGRRVQGRRHLVPDVQHVPRHTPAAGGRVPHLVADGRGRPAAARPGPPLPDGHPLGGDAADGGDVRRLPAGRRPGLDDRRRQPDLPDRNRAPQRRRVAAAAGRAGEARPYRAPDRAISLGVAAALAWAAATVLGFAQFGLPTVLFGLALAYSGAAFYALRRRQDRGARGRPGCAFPCTPN